MSQRKIKGVLIDMDGTLFNTELTSLFAWGAVGREFGLKIDKDFMISCIGLPTGVIEKNFYARFGEKTDYKKLRARKLEIMEDIVRQSGPDLKPGAPELLEYAREAGLKRALVTSTTLARARFNLDAGGMIDYFDDIITCEMIKNGKPNPDPYILGAGRLGLTPFDCAVIEDSENGVLSAAASGALTILVPDLVLSDRMKALADHRCDNLFDVIELLKTL